MSYRIVDKFEREQGQVCTWCGAEVAMDKSRFRNDIYYIEFLRTGLCQECQDKQLNGEEDY